MPNRLNMSPLSVPHTVKMVLLNWDAIGWETLIRLWGVLFSTLTQLEDSVCSNIFTLTFRNQSLFTIQCFRVICARQLLRAVPLPKAHCVGTAPWFSDNINARQMSLNYIRRYAHNIRVVDWPIFFATNKFLKNLQGLLRPTQYSATISSKSTKSKTFPSLLVGKSIGNELAYLCFKLWCVIFWVLWPKKIKIKRSQIKEKNMQYYQISRSHVSICSKWGSLSLVWVQLGN